MEIFAPCYPSEFGGSLYTRVERMQEILGRANDAQVAMATLQRWSEQAQYFSPSHWRNWQAGSVALLESCKDEQARYRREFEAFWEVWKEDRIGARLRGVIES
jgi:CHAD domain-containing protein